MASTKDTFESKTFASNTYACGTFRGTGVTIISVDLFPGGTTFTRSGPGAVTFARQGPGNVTIAKKQT